MAIRRRVWRWEPRAWWVGLAALLLGLRSAGADEPVALRAESFTVPPSTQPLAFVRVKNLQDVPYQGTLSMRGPEGWRFAPKSRTVELPAGQTGRVPFTIQRAVNLDSNAYPIEISATGAGMTVVRRQNVVCASAPYFKPTIDGDPAEWDDAIPVTFRSGGKTTVIRTYWNRRQFSVLIAVEEDKLTRSGEAQVYDAVQIALSPEDSTTGTSADDEAARFEFLLTAAEDGGGKCFRLATPDMKLAEAARRRALGPLEYADATLAVSRKDGVTWYECGLAFKPLRGHIRPSEGREFFFSVLVHDPDGTGIRDLGEAVGLWPWQRNPLAWSRWTGARWAETPALDNKVRWGLCTSKY